MTNSPLKTYDHTKPHRRHEHTANAALNWSSKRESFINIMQRVIRTRKARLLVSTVTERWPALIHKAEQANHAVCEKTHGTSIVNRMITQTGMMWLNTWHQPRDSCELDLLGRMHPSESIGFPYLAGYPRLSVWACISVMKAIITHPLR